MRVVVFQYLVITGYKGIDQRQMYIEYVINERSLTKFRNAVIAYKELVRGKYGDQLGIGKP